MLRPSQDILDEIRFNNLPKKYGIMARTENEPFVRHRGVLGSHAINSGTAAALGHSYNLNSESGQGPGATTIMSLQQQHSNPVNPTLSGLSGPFGKVNLEAFLPGIKFSLTKIFLIF